MKLYFQESEHWQPERYHYAAEQMMLTLFPGERPEYPQEPPAPEENWVLFQLARDAGTARIAALVCRAGRQARGEDSFPAAALDEAPEKVYHVVQHALKMAFYRAGTTLLGREPPWGALTGVRPVKLPTRSLRAGASPDQACRELEREYRVSPVRARLAVDWCRCTSASPSAPPGAPTAPLCPPTWAGR